MSSTFYQNRIYPIVYMAIVAGVLVTVVSVIDAFTKDQVEANRQWLTNKALLSVSGLATRETVDDLPAREANALVETNFTPIMQDERIPEPQRTEGVPTGPLDIWRVTEKGSDALKGYVFAVEGMGYWDTVVGYAFVAPDKTTLQDIIFVEHKETPGLGGEITNPEFTQRFEGVKLDEAITIASPADADDPNAIEAITGATRTSKALEVFLNEDFATFRETIDEAAGGGSNE